MSNFPSLLFSLCKCMFFPSCSHYIGQCLLNCPVFHWPNLYEHTLVCLVCCFLKTQVRWASGHAKKFHSMWRNFLCTSTGSLWNLHSGEFAVWWKFEVTLFSLNLVSSPSIISIILKIQLQQWNWCTLSGWRLEWPNIYKAFVTIWCWCTGCLSWKRSLVLHIIL